MELLERIEAAGIVGCGGAGFPTHKKLSGNMEYLIVNGVECEPVLCTDRYLMRECAPQLIRAVQALKTELHVAHCVIAVKGHYYEEISALRHAIEDAGADIAIHILESFYPAGDEQTVVYEVTGRIVPPASIPMAVGAVVSNVATIYAISEAFDGIPFTQKFLTVAGAVAKPMVLRVPIGTDYETCLALAGGTTHRNYVAVNGGPMMGKLVPQAEISTAVVTKTTSGILVLPEDSVVAQAAALDLHRMQSRAASACIQCTACTELCPRHLLGHPLKPHRIMRKLAMGGPLEGMLDDPDLRSAQLCCECGVCEIYACPMGMHPRKLNHMVKEALAGAGIRYQATSEIWTASALRENRKVPSARIAARVGLWRENGEEIRVFRRGEPDRVALPLKMHIGVPTVPLVHVGDVVAVGDVIGRPPEGALGAVLHASIAGRITAVNDRIVIERE